MHRNGSNDHFGRAEFGCAYLVMAATALVDLMSALMSDGGEGLGRVLIRFCMRGSLNSALLSSD
jgi:hypothetical protein